MAEISQRLAYFWLGTSKAGTKKLNTILSVYSPLEIYEKIERGGFDKILGEELCEELIKSKREKKLENALSRLAEEDITIVTRADPEYPERLAQREVNPPLFLYCKGDTSLLRTDCIGMVGTRSSSRYGKEVAEMLTRGLVAGGITVVSGLATGIDGYAHAETLNGGGRTIAVLGTGFDKIYPSTNAPLAARILKGGGLLVSEYPPSFPPARYSFPERNRIISGLSLGIVIVEAGKPSGTLITAECALEQGREVFAVPGNITSERSKGTNELILKGHAIMVTDVQQIFDELKLTAPSMKKNTPFALDFVEQIIYDLLSDEARAFDEILIESGLSAAELTTQLLGMELRGIVKRLPSNYYSR